MTGIPASAEDQPSLFPTLREGLTSVTLASVQNAISAERDDHTDDRDDDDANVEGDGPRVDGGENLAGGDGVDGAEANKGYEVEERGEDSSEEAVAVERASQLDDSKLLGAETHE